MCLKSIPIWISPFIYLFSSFFQERGFLDCRMQSVFLAFPTFPSFRRERWCGFLTINTQRGERAAVWSPSWAGHGRPSLSLWDLLFAPQNVHKPFWSDDGKRPSHETRLVVSDSFWWDLSFLSTTQNWNQSLSSSVPKTQKTKSSGSQIACKGQGRMSAVWVACLSAYFESLSRTPRCLMMVSFKVLLFFFFFYLHHTSLPAGSSMLTREHACFTTELWPACHRSGGCRRQALQSRPRGSGVRGGGHVNSDTHEPWKLPEISIASISLHLLL